MESRRHKEYFASETYLPAPCADCRLRHGISFLLRSRQEEGSGRPVVSGGSGVTNGVDDSGGGFGSTVAILATCLGGCLYDGSSLRTSALSPLHARPTGARSGCSSSALGWADFGSTSSTATFTTSSASAEKLTSNSGGSSLPLYRLDSMCPPLITLSVTKEL